VISVVNHSCINGFTIRNGKAGGINCYFSSLIIANNTITNNITSGGGGGIYCHYSSPKIVNNIVDGNITTGNGGGIYCYYSSPTILNNIISGNRTFTNGYGGGGIYCSYSAVNIINNIIAGNIASGSGGGILCDYQSSPVITNNTICGNSVSAGNNGGGIFFYYSLPTISNNIISFNSSGIHQQSSSSTPTLYNNNVYENTAYDYSGLSAGEGDISVDPLFVNRAAGDYHLLPTSPCINKGWNSASGIPETDMDGQPRLNGVIDIGADEYWMPPSEAIGAARSSGDDLPQDIFGANVSAAFDDFFYIEADDRSSGIRVNKAGHALSEGMRARVIGILTTNEDGERCIEATDASRCTSPFDKGSVISLGMSNKMIGGGDWQYNSITGAGQRGVLGGIGLNNIGLLIRTFGKVVDRDTSLIPTWYKISDGSPTGSIKVVVPAGSSVPALDSYVTVMESVPVIKMVCYTILRYFKSK
jgi:parallel beta-helix repeat protein